MEQVQIDGPPSAEQIACNWVTWLDALASGEYRKGVLALRDTEMDSYCCLGVAHKALGLDATKENAYEAIQKNLGLHSTYGSSIEGEEPTIVHLNDSVYYHDVDFSNMRRTLLEKMEEYVRPEVAALVREKIQ